jgi:hypothetical protein
VGDTLTFVAGFNAYKNAVDEQKLKTIATGISKTRTYIIGDDGIIANLYIPVLLLALLLLQ